MKQNNLSTLCPGEIGIVTGIKKTCAIKRRLQDLGVVQDTKIQCLYKSPLGDPTAFFIRGAVIALREEDSESIRIQKRDVLKRQGE